MVTPHYVSAKELAVILGRHYRTVVKDAREGLLPFIKVGKAGRKRYDPEEVKRQLGSQ